MKTQLLACIVAFGISFLLIPADAEPISQEEFLKTYQPILDRIQNEKLPPQKQLKLGILMRDVICPDDKVQILKIASSNQVSCVSSDTAQNLLKRGWGLVHRDDPNTGKGGSECTNLWVIHHDGSNKPSISKLQQTLRLTVNEFSNEYVVWSPITIVDAVGKTMTLQSHGSFYPEQESTILENLSKVENVLNVSFEPGRCI